MIGDFGLSRSLEETTATHLQYAGSFRYMGPELLNGKSKSPRSDSWAYGMTIYQVSRWPDIIPVLNSLSGIEWIATLRRSQGPVRSSASRLHRKTAPGNRSFPFHHGCILQSRVEDRSWLLGNRPLQSIDNGRSLDPISSDYRPGKKLGDTLRGPDLRLVKSRPREGSGSEAEDAGKRRERSKTGD